MSRFFTKRLEKLTPYTPGEQPRDMQYIKLNTNESPFPPSPAVVEAAKAEAGRLQLYSDPTCREITDKLASLYGVSPEQVILTNGSDEVLNFAFMAFADEDHPLVFPAITYGFYPVFAELNRIPYTEVPLKENFSVDYQDYLNTHHLPMWPADSERQQRLREFCHSHNDSSDYAPFVVKMSDEEMANLLLTPCHQTDKMMCSYIEKLEHRFVTEGGIKERMYAARTGYRQTVDAHVQALEAENQQLKTKVKALEEELKKALEELGISRRC